MISKLQNSLLVSLAKRNAYPGKQDIVADAMNDLDHIWFDQHQILELVVCLICGKQIKQDYFSDDRIYKHGLDHIKEYGLMIFV